MPDDRVAFNAPGAPPAVGPYSHGVKHGGLLFCSGQLALDASGNLVEGSVTDQARLALENLQRICEAAGTQLSRAVRCTVYLTDIATFADVNEVYGSFFDDEPPARVAFGVAALPKGGAVEIDAVVAL